MDSALSPLRLKAPSYLGGMLECPEMFRVYSDANLFQTWLETEAALARAEASLGLIPASSSAAISSISLDKLDMEAMKAEYERVGFPILPFVHQLQKLCDPESAKYIHWGATTQDIIDTGLVLQMRDGLRLIEADLADIIHALATLCETHRNTVMAGRTFQQHAAPITFGYKAAVWLDELLRHRDRLPDLKKRALVVQFGGAVGTLSTLGKDGLKVLKELARELDLEEPAISWHTARDGWAELIHWIAMLGATLGKIATEVSTLMRSEVDELREPYVAGKGGSSTMPQKRNPTACPVIIAAANRLRDLVPSQLTAMIQMHERDVATQPLEWMVIPEAFLVLSGSLKHAKPMLANLYVNTERMKENLNSGGGFLMAEAVMMGLAPKIGRGQAHELVKKASNHALDQGKTLREGLIETPEVMEHLSEAELDTLLDPLNYTGVASEMIDRVLTKAGSREQGGGSGVSHAG